MSEMDWAEIPRSQRCKEEHTLLGHPDTTHRCRRGDDHQGPHMCKQGHVWTVVVFDLERRRARALQCSTCNGSKGSRETTGLVCQSCGWDYGQGEPRS